MSISDRTEKAPAAIKLVAAGDVFFTLHPFRM